MNPISHLASFSYSHFLDEVALNPQPLPPGPPDPEKRIFFSSENKVALNPQPLPPGPPDPDGKINLFVGDNVSINPQPLPPGPDPEVQFNSFAKVADELNPQPLPPGPSEAIVHAWNSTSVFNASHVSVPQWLLSSLHKL